MKKLDDEAISKAASKPKQTTKAAPEGFKRLTFTLDLERRLFVDHDRRLAVSQHALGELTNQQQQKTGNYALTLMPEEAAKLPRIEELMRTWYERAFS